MPDVVATNSAGDKVAIRLNGTNADITAGGTESKQSGALVLKNRADHTIVSLGSRNVNQSPIEINELELSHPQTGEPTIRFNAGTGDAVIGGGETDGSLKLRNSDNGVTIQMDAQAGTIVLKNADPTIRLEGESGKIFLIADGKTRVHIDGTNAIAWLGGKGRAGQIGVFASGATVNDDPAKAMIHLSSEDAALRVGGAGKPGTIYLSDQGKVKIQLDANANVWMGGNGKGGQIGMFASDVTAIGDPAKAMIHLSSEDAALRVGGAGKPGTIYLSDQGKVKILLNATAGEILLNDDDKNRIRLDASHANISLGGNGENGSLMLFHQDETANNDHTKATIHLNGKKGNIRLGGNGQNGDLMLFHKDEPETDDHTKATVYLDGTNGDIVLRNADCAEDFDIAESERIEPGTVMVLDQEGKLQQSTGAYDKKVAGVISGAGDFKAGIVLDKKHSVNHRLPIALMGKVYCKADAQYSSIDVGDLLTTSDTPGHAMKAMEPLKAFGAVVGKALRGLKDGRGLIPILVSLQ